MGGVKKFEAPTQVGPERQPKVRHLINLTKVEVVGDMQSVVCVNAATGDDLLLFCYETHQFSVNDVNQDLWMELAGSEELCRANPVREGVRLPQTQGESLAEISERHMQTTREEAGGA